VGLTFAVVGSLFEPLGQFSGGALGARTVQLLGRQAGLLASGIAPWTDTAFNSFQIGRLAAEFRALARDEAQPYSVRRDLTEAADLIELETAGRSQVFVVFLGN
jgi:hypothetical protein